jgi:RsiW-degrading membrane proteinase PrsW (M82 family)
LRAVLAVPGHAIWGAFIGYCGAMKRRDGRGPGLLGGYAIAVAMHGSYDAAIFLQVPLRLQGVGGEALLLLVVPVGIVVFGAIAIRGRARKAVEKDDEEAARGMGGVEAVA